MSIDPILTVWSRQLREEKKRGAKVLSAYHDQRPFSVELVGAVSGVEGASPHAVRHATASTSGKVRTPKCGMAHTLDVGGDNVERNSHAV